MRLHAAMEQKRTLLPRPYLGERWIKFTNPFTCRLPTYACCYCVFDSTRLLYVGQTSNLKYRFRAHKASRAFPAGVFIKARFGDRYGDWAMRELRLIRRLRPPMNMRVV